MFKYIKSIKSHFKNYQLYNGHLLVVFLDDSGYTVVNNYDAKSFTIRQEIKLGCKTFYNFFFREEMAIAYYPMQRLVKFNLNSDEKITTKELKIAPDLLVKNCLLGISIDDNSKKTLTMMDLDSLKRIDLLNEPFRLWESNGEAVIGVKVGKGQEIYSIDTLTGSINWQNNIADELSGKVISHNEIIIVVGRNMLYGLSSKNGKLVWKSKSNEQLQIYGGKIINVDSGHYREFSPDTGKTLIEYAMKSEYEKHGFTVPGPLGAFTVTETHVYIVHAMGSKLACINRSNGKIDWSAVVGDGRVSLPNAPLICESMLYVLDDEGTLHIFEKE